MSSPRFLQSAVLLICTLLALPMLLLAGAPHVRRSVVVEVVEKVRPAVVNIHSERSARGPAFDEWFTTTPSQSRSHGLGTGIVIDPRGYVITNQHVVEGVSVIRVRLNDGTTHTARILARDREHDLALMRIDVGRPLPTIPLGTSSDLMVGETVIAVGNAYGYEHTVTVGVISALHRDVTLNKDIAYKALIQTDASINPGNSGGPLLNIEGKLIGVNVAIRAGAQGIGFAIPVDQTVEAVTHLLSDARRPELSHGLFCRNRIDLSQSSPRFVEVEKVDAASPAAKAGLQSGDVLLQAGSVLIASSIDFERALLSRKPGESLFLLVRRGAAEQQMELTLEAPTPAVPTGADGVWRHLGLRLAPTVGEIAIPTQRRMAGGLIVTDVNPESPASHAGLKRGDVLIGLHQWETTKIDDVAYVLNHPQLSTFYPLQFYFLRSGKLLEGFIQHGE